MNQLPPILFFDGVCAFCNSSVNMLMKLDRKKRLRYAPLQGETASENLHPEVIDRFDSLVLLENNHVLFKSSAVIRALIIAGGIGRLAVIFYIIPRCTRDWLYTWIGKNRYKWFGKRDTCRLPTENEKDYLLH